MIVEGTWTYAYTDAGIDELRQQKTGPLRQRLNAENRPLILVSHLTADRRCGSESGSVVRRQQLVPGFGLLCTRQSSGW
jgi:hypothetical protein